MAQHLKELLGTPQRVVIRETIRVDLTAHRGSVSTLPNMSRSGCQSAQPPEAKQTKVETHSITIVP